jgi:tetratricopeptide (TPR) repeat protein
VYYDKNAFDESIADNTRAIELSGEYADAYYNRGLAHNEKGEKSKAIADFEAYLELLPDAEDRDEVLQIIGDLKK